MAKKKAKKSKKAKKAVKGKRAIKRKRAVKIKKAVKAVKPKAKAKEKVLGMVDHFFGKISVAAIKVKAPIKVGDVIHIKGHTTDFTQKVESMQIEHEDMIKAKKGDDIGIKVKEHVREHDIVYLSAEKQESTAQPAKPATVKQSYSETRFLKF